MRYSVTAERHSRDALATLLWPDSNQRAARTSLRSRLSELNAVLGKGWIEADRETVALRDGYWLDVRQFKQHVGQEVDAQELVAAVDLYRGDFLAGFTLPGSAEFDDWQFHHTESLRREFATALERLSHAHAGRPDSDTAFAYARRRVALDPWKKRRTGS